MKGTKIRGRRWRLYPHLEGKQIMKQEHGEDLHKQRHHCKKESRRTGGELLGVQQDAVSSDRRTCIPAIASKEMEENKRESHHSNSSRSRRGWGHWKRKIL